MPVLITKDCRQIVPPVRSVRKAINACPQRERTRKITAYHRIDFIFILHLQLYVKA